LPVEIWDNILQCFLYIPHTFDTEYCGVDFHLFIEWRQSLKNAQRKIYFELLQEWVRLRQVCKAWKWIIDRQPVPWIFTRKCWNHVNKSPNRVDFRLYHSTNYINTPSDTLCGYELCHYPLRFGDAHRVSIMAISDAWCITDLKPLLLGLSNNFPSIASLTYSTNVDGSAQSYTQPAHGSLLPRLTDVFGSLKCLKITCESVRGSITMDNLEILSLDIGDYDPRSWWFPSLVHCHLGEKIMKRHRYTVQLLPCFADKLRSLLLSQSEFMALAEGLNVGDEDLTVVADDTFWQNHCSLQYLGIRFSLFRVSSPPPDRHPLREIYFAESRDL
ncbi:hypothetical protein CPB86DRAFT_663835, partial [Serendipita vermifera]